MATTFLDDLFPPGEYIRDELDTRGWTQEDLASIMGRPSTAVSQIINGVKAITPQTARQLAAAFGTSAELWLNLESAYRLALQTADNSDVARRAKIYAKAPIADMMRRGWIAKLSETDALEREVLRFLQISSFDDTPQLATAARKSDAREETTAAQVAWLCRVRELAVSLPAERFTKSGLEKHLAALHALTASEHEVRKVPAVLAKMGIRFALVQHLPRTRIDGYTLWLDDNSPAIALTLRYDRIDGFWHTLAHELSHVRHEDRPLVDSDLVGASAVEPTDDMERRANAEASSWLIPSDKLNSFVMRTKPRYSKSRIIQFANRHQIHPGIVVGQLQFRSEIEYRHDREMLVSVRSILSETALTDGWDNIPHI